MTSAPAAFPPSGTYCPIVFLDVAGSAGPDRDDDVQQAVRDGLYAIVQRAFARAGVAAASYYRQDHGDAVLAVMPPTVPLDAVADLPQWLHPEILRHNKCASAAAQIRLRGALHIGPVNWDEHGVSGRAVVHTARLLEAPPARRALATGTADLAFVVSAHVYEAVIQHKPHQGTYQPIQGRVKETLFNAWLTLAATPAQTPHLAAVPTP